MQTAPYYSLADMMHAYHGLLEAGRTLSLSVMRGAVGVFLVSKGLQLPQVHHGFNHHLQRAHAMRPAPPRALGGVRSDLADDSMLDRRYGKCKVNHNLYSQGHE